MGAESALSTGAQVTLPLQYQRLLLAVDASDHANRATLEAVAIAARSGAGITASHAYAAMMHDRRFRQMEGGLPEQFRAEQELERQRVIHDDLITRGLSIITDSYLDHAQRVCHEANVEFERCALEGKNYRALTDETNSGDYDLLVIGGRGLGAIPGGGLGTVCTRVVRRAQIDTLVIKDPQAGLAGGPIVVAVDGSPRAWGGLLTGITLAHHWQCPLHVVAAFDPYYHYVAFNRIAGVLSEEAGKVFRFQEQEKLHEEIIDSGLAKIYQGHLEVAESLADEHHTAVTTRLLDGKPHDVIAKYVEKIKPSLLVLGKLGIHADPGLDIGGNTEHLMHDVGCALLISQREYCPAVETVADVTTSWTQEAEQSIARVPQFAQAMARTAILREANKLGHTVITANMVDEITATLCPAHATRAMREIVEADERGELKSAAPVGPMPWSAGATALLDGIREQSEKDNIRSRAQKKARIQGAVEVLAEHVEDFVAKLELARRCEGITWQAGALARLAQVPSGFMRDACQRQTEQYAHGKGVEEVTPEVVEVTLRSMGQRMHGAQTSVAGGKCPLGHDRLDKTRASEPNRDTAIGWSASALARLERVPVGFMRELVRQRVEVFAERHGQAEITEELIERKYVDWAAGSERQSASMPWHEDVRKTVERIPEFVRGMVVKEMERCAQEMGLTEITREVLHRARGTWTELGTFHSETNPSQYGSSQDSAKTT